jgi:hypothetical protein
MLNFYYMHKYDNAWKISHNFSVHFHSEEISETNLIIMASTDTSAAT